MRAVIYCRISDDRTGLAAGVQRQEDDARSLCARNGWDIVGVEVDNDISASRYSRKVRPAYQRVLAMAAAGEVDVIACYDVDRLYRRPAELEELIDLAGRTTIASVQGDLRLDTSDGRAMARVIAAFAAKSSDDTSRRVKRKHLATAEAGLPSGGGPRPFGFEDDRVTLRVSEAARIDEAARRILGGDSLGAICRDWNAAGVLTPKGNRWETSSLRRMLEAPRVAGKRSLGSVVVADAVWPAILEAETWEAVRSVLAGRSWPIGPQPRSYLLSGLIFCECGAAMTAHPLTARGKRYRRYFCLTTRGGCNRVGISADRCEAVIVKALLDGLDGSLRAPVAMEADREAEVRRAALTAERDALDAEVGRGLSVRSYGVAMRRIEEEINALDRVIAASSTDRELAELAAAPDPESAWDLAPFNRKRRMIERSLVRVTIDRADRSPVFEPGRIHPEWRS